MGSQVKNYWLESLSYLWYNIYSKQVSYMKIKLLSDLHTEFKPSLEAQEYLRYEYEDILILAGDIASGSTNTSDLIKKFKREGYKDIIFVPGNHEYYGTEIRDFDAKMVLKCKALEDVHFLNPGWVKIKDTIFIGGTLWTNFRCNPLAELDATSGIADFHLIKGFRPELASLLYYKHLKLFMDVNKLFPTEKKVFISHFLPTVECISPRFRQSDNLINNYFANDLTEFVESLENSTWVFGHTHDSVDITIGTTRLISNPYGYYGSEVNPNFKPYLYI